ncbi:hypothetical protein INT48_009372, partial [Thamnidium elegans]
MEPELISLDPLFLTNAKLFIKDIRSLAAIENVFGELYRLYDHIIKLVEICGVIVGVEQTYSHITYTVDDNSDTIACYLWRNEVLDNQTPLKLGDIVRVFGRIEEGPEDRRIITSEIFGLDNPNEELCHSVQTMVLDSEYRKPYKLPECIENNKQMLIDELRSKTKDIQCDTDEDLFTKAVFQFLKDNSTHAAFMISLPRKDAKLNDLAKKVISKKQANEPSKRQIIYLFEKALTNLCKRKLAVRSVDKPGMFELVDELAVEKCILRTIADILERTSSRVNGVRLEYIMVRVKKEFRDLEADYIEEVMNNLSAKGLIYPIGDKEYR